ncbi:MAG: hypothetical protein U5N86_03110 [Planctomycetota bacterium]|nr:hypothetical protein [Planctomycetota bacterium]
MRKLTIVANVLILMLFCATLAGANTISNPPFISRPDISPDGSQVVFEYGGDLWLVPFSGGEAKRLTLHMALETRPYFSPDGQTILFAANYSGYMNLYTMPVEGGEPNRLTHGPSSDVPSGWSADGKHVYFYSSLNGSFDAYRVSASGGTPAMIAGALNDAVYGAAPSPDGSKVAFCYRSSYAERNRADNKTYFTSEIYLADNTTPAENFERLTKNMYQDFIPLWSADGKYLYFISDRDGAYNVYRKKLRSIIGGEKKITDVDDYKGVRWLSLSQSGRAVVLYNYKLYSLDLDKGDMTPIDIELYDPPRFTYPASVQRNAVVQDFAVAPDGKKVAYVSNYDVFITASTGGYSKHLVATACREDNITWSRDSNYVVFNRIIDKAMNIVRVDVRTGEEEVLTTGSVNRFGPTYTPDGKAISYQRNHDSIWMMDPDGSNHRMVVELDLHRRLLQDFRRFEFTPDGKWMLITAYNSAGRYDIYAKKMGDDSEPIDLCPLGGFAFPGGFTPDYKSFVFNVNLMNNINSFVIDFEQQATKQKSAKQKLRELLEPPEERRRAGKDRA